MISTLIYLLIVCIIVGLLWWVITLIPMPEPIRRVVTVIFVVIVVLVLIFQFLLPLAHVPLHH